MAQLNSRQWQIINRKRSRFFRKYSRAFAIALGKQIERVEKNILIDFNTIVDRVPELVNTQDLMKPYVDLYKEVGGFFALDTLKGLQKASETEILSVYEQALEVYGMTLATENLKQITSTSISEAQRILRPIISEALDEGFGVEKTATNIKKRFGVEYGKNQRWRAKRIAQTELIGASNQGAFEAARSVDFPVVKQWLAGGPNVRDTHIIVSSTAPIPLDQFFTVGKGFAMQPGDMINLENHPEELVNCHCALSTRPAK